MPHYLAQTTTWLSHENRMVKAGERFETTFPKIKGQPMRLSSNIELLPDEPVKPAKTGKSTKGDDSLV